MAHPFVHADETPVRQQTGEAARTGYFWAWLAGRQLYLHFGHGRSQAEALAVTGVDPEGGWPPGSTLGFVVCDGYDGYNPLFTDGTVQRVACWSHVRRKFTDYEETDRNAAAMVERINDLFRVERQATKDIQKGRLDDTAAAALRLARRQESGRPIVTDIKARLERLHPLYTPKSGMRTAINYALTLWTALEIFLADGRLPADNNAAERALRPVAIGRRTGSSSARRMPGSGQRSSIRSSKAAACAGSIPGGTSPMSRRDW